MDSRSNRKLIFDRLGDIYYKCIIENHSFIKGRLAEVMADMKSQYCCCVVISRRKRRRRRRKRWHNLTESEEIKRLLCPCLNMTSESTLQRKVDFIARLPIEISQLILRKLNPESLLLAACVSKTWLEVCSSDNIVRKKARKAINWKKKRQDNTYYDCKSRIRCISISKLIR